MSNGFLYCWTDASRKSDWYKVGVSRNGKLMERLNKEKGEVSNPGELYIQFIWEPSFNTFELERRWNKISIDNNYKPDGISNRKEWFVVDVERMKKDIKTLDPNGRIVTYNDAIKNESNKKDLIDKLAKGELGNYKFVLNNNPRHCHCYQRCKKIFNNPITVNEFFEDVKKKKINNKYINFDIYQTKAKEGRYTWGDLKWDIIHSYITLEN
jgi:hypothetical protein